MSNQGVLFRRPFEVEIASMDFPKLEFNGGKCEHGVLVRILAAGVCGSDLHHFRGKSSAPEAMPLGHEMLGEVIEKGRDVQLLKVGDIVSIPFNVACGRCSSCKSGKTQFCMGVNPGNPNRPGAMYGVPYSPWGGAQAEYSLVPYADFNLLPIANSAWAKERLADLILLSDVFPTGYHCALQAGVGVGKFVYVAGAGPIGLACAASSLFLGAACVIVGDINPKRLKQAKMLGCETLDLRNEPFNGDTFKKMIGQAGVDCACDCVGYEAHGHGTHAAEEVSLQAWNDCLSACVPGGQMNAVGIYLPGTVAPELHSGGPAPAWVKGLGMSLGTVPVIRYHRELLRILEFDRINLATILNVKTFPLSEAQAVYSLFEKGEPMKPVLIPGS